MQFLVNFYQMIMEMQFLLQSPKQQELSLVVVLLVDLVG